LRSSKCLLEILEIKPGFDRLGRHVIYGICLATVGWAWAGLAVFTKTFTAIRAITTWHINIFMIRVRIPVLSR
jgi:hypothetical protein